MLHPKWDDHNGDVYSNWSLIYAMNTLMNLIHTPEGSLYTDLYVVHLLYNTPNVL